MVYLAASPGLPCDSSHGPFNPYISLCNYITEGGHNFDTGATPCQLLCISYCDNIYIYIYIVGLKKSSWNLVLKCPTSPFTGVPLAPHNILLPAPWDTTIVPEAFQLFWTLPTNYFWSPRIKLRLQLHYSIPSRYSPIVITSEYINYELLSAASNRQWISKQTLLSHGLP
jgi:hypothetical protein